MITQNQHNNYWLGENTTGFHQMKIPLKEKVYQMISDRIQSSESNSVMDYGCGLGNQIDHLPKTYEIGLFDIDLNILNQAHQRLGDYNCKKFEEPENIPSDYYDSVIFGMVMMCVKDPYQLDSVISQLKRIRKTTGLLYCTVTHPAFRIADYSYFKNIIPNQEFEYNKNGEEFTVLIKENNITFSDYHWNLSYTLNAFFDNGFNLVELQEIKDEKYSGSKNHNYPPYMLLIFN